MADDHESTSIIHIHNGIVNKSGCTVKGDYNQIRGSGNRVIGDFNIILGSGNRVYGRDNKCYGSGNTVIRTRQRRAEPRERKRKKLSHSPPKCRKPRLLVPKKEEEEIIPDDEGRDTSGDCTICCERLACTAIIDCGHASMCIQCIRRILMGPLKKRKCPLCKAPIVKGAMRIFN